MPQRPTSAEISQISALISRLLTHYWTGDEHPAVRQAQIEDWLEDLAAFSPAVVEAACTRWRQAEYRRPTPADIRPLAIEERDTLAWRTAKALPPPIPVPTQHQRELAEERRLAIAINQMRYDRGDAYRRGYLAQWDAANLTALHQARHELDQIRNRHLQAA